jgi:hypothetical protein
VIDIGMAKHSEAPFRHWVIDSALPNPLAHSVFNELSQTAKLGLENYYRYDSPFEDKYALDKFEHFPPTVRILMNYALTGPFVDLLEELTGIKGLIADPHIRGGGIHLHGFGGKLDIHKDFDWHPRLNLVRKINLLIYFNKNYEKAHGGELDLWSKDMSKCESKLEPIFNRAVIFETPDAPHGLGSPWRASHFRKSLALYYYVAPTKEDFEREHWSTRFLAKPGEVDSPEVAELRQKRAKGRLATNI